MIGAFGGLVGGGDYIAALLALALALHIFHASWSMFQTFGVNSRRWNLAIRRFAVSDAAGPFVGFASLPLGVAAPTTRPGGLPLDHRPRTHP